MRDGVAELAQVHATGLHHLGCVLIVDEREQQVLQRRIFVMALGRMGQRIVQGGFQGRGE